LTLTVFVAPYETNPYATFRIKVEAIDGLGSFVDYIVLNPDPENTRIVPAVEEYHTPDYLRESPAIVNFADPTVLSEEIVYTPDLSYIVENVNPDIVAPTLRSPTYRSGDIINPTYRSSSVGDLSGGTVTDLQWRIKNNNDAASAYSFRRRHSDRPGLLQALRGRTSRAHHEGRIPDAPQPDLSQPDLP